MLSVVCCQWNEGFRKYLPEHVNVLQRMVARNLPKPHRFICMTCETEGFDPAVELLKTPPAALELAKLRSPHGERYPSCYRRLWLFSDEARVLGERILLLDIDCIIFDDITSLVDRDEDFVGWKPKSRCGWNPGPRLNGGIWLLRTGTRTEVYENFEGQRSISRASNEGYGGSDQAWLSYCLAKDAAAWSNKLICSVRENRGRPVPGALIMHYNGPVKPWERNDSWIKEHWR